MTALPILSPNESLNQDTRVYLDALECTAYAGDIEISYGSRLAVATDNSIYQQLPQAVLHPRNTQDLSLIAKVAADMPSVSFSARGGGTGTNGQSLTPGIIVDTSRYMNQIVEHNIEEGWVTVQSGVVKDALNDYLRPFGYFFSPDLSTSNRATVGGMISTDASGQGSLVYGKTSDHVLSLTSVLANGEIITTSPMPLDEAQELARGNSALSRVVKQVIATSVNKREQIIEKFPRLNRFLTGYDLEHAYDDKKQEIDISRLITGAEGSLAFVAEAKLNITKIPKYTALVNVKYDLFESALRHAPSMIAAKATSVETVDSTVLNMARADIIWHSVADLITDVENKTMLGLNMVEYNSDDKQEIENKIALLSDELTRAAEEGRDGVIGFQVTYERSEINKIYAMRKKSVGLLGKTKGVKKPIAFAEDTAVPPENLADFIMEFRDLLDSHGLKYGMFGHVDAGVLHVRPALDLCDMEQEKLVNTISDQVVALVAKYGGLMWGEHGKGYRSEYAPAFFGDELYTELRKVKTAFDPMNKMNPGKICTPVDSTAKMVKVADIKRATFDRTIPIAFKEAFAPAMSCNGNGLCFNYDTTSPMCPSSKITQDRRHSPKGRAGLIREWLRLLGQANVATDNLSHKQFSSSFLARFIQSRSSWKKQNKDDFSHEVFDAMNGCLACKSCSSQCPVGVDVPDFRARFLAIYYQRYSRPLKDYFVANVETLAPAMAKFPRFFNFFLDASIVKLAIKKAIGYVDAPLLSVPNLRQRVARLDCERSLQSLESLSTKDRQNYVVVVQDPFTSFYDAQSVEKLLIVIQKLGLFPVLLPFSPNGKAQHVKGFLDRFEKTADTTASLLNKVHDLGLPMIGADASLVLCYRDEYAKILGSRRGSFSVQTVTEWLSALPQERISKLRVNREQTQVATVNYRLLAHCTEKTALPKTEQQWQAVFQSLDLRLNIVPVGCCGMAGTYGHEVEQLANSKGIYDLSWAAEIKSAEAEGADILATGYSCRSQVKRFESFRPKHPIEILAEL
ncbi:FAD-binding oxidoreductase [Glaciecola sp. MH2013]|uniref:D-2-hydroxyglutarate dehydrogenase YdiJ n=1 Tax=Glaciecola sp. MH2013 TaxID=2785524 RepID=UPI0018A0729A|nr:FAD-binding and (Fe-S)-binding domain-containing protein [Glaciecola sp. MH2013]MBF7072997.1 FAD-binding oxidoreductase [Glaciecola sp. MH2013]